ncbi:unnamed protein product [Arabis nemorensis]|uniref:Ubiquitin-like protease family profile domain-containing protein n=1 Tax=Arabis nemorensis TaxID=586526 RepID=A0A565BVK4_9BRAS|nr:unnamed protein product [Arabis nemorensis]
MENPSLPLCVFADREEPVGDRVNCYFKLNIVRVVLRALQPEELDLREFGVVTGLRCSPIPQIDQDTLIIGDGTDPESGDEESRPVIALKLEKLWELDEEDTMLVLLPFRRDGETDDYSWADEGDDTSVAHMEKLINDGVIFSCDMFEGGQRGYGAPAAPNSKNPGKAKRKGESKSCLDESELVGSSRTKKARLHCSRDRPISSDAKSKILEVVSCQIKVVMSECKTMIANSVHSGFQHVESRLDMKLEKVVPSLVRDCLKSKDADEVVKEVLKIFRSCDGVFDEPGENVPEGSAVGDKKSPKKPMEVDGDITSDDDLCTGNSGDDDLCTGNPVVPESAPVQKMDFYCCNAVHILMELDFGASRYLKDGDLLTIPISIDPCVMDSCVMVMRDVILSGPNLTSNVRANILHCGFVVSLAKQLSKFKKISRKDSFEFDPDFVDVVRIRMKETEKQWIKDIDSIYFPFNIDRTRWVGVSIEFFSHLMTVFDPSASEMRSSQLKSKLDFICEMFPFLVRKSSVNNGMKNFSTKVISFKKDTSVVQASSRADTCILSLLFIEAHVIGGIDEVYEVKKVILRERAEQLIVDMYVHCCGDIDLSDV